MDVYAVSVEVAKLDVSACGEQMEEESRSYLWIQWWWLR